MYTPSVSSLRNTLYSCGYEPRDMRFTRVKCGSERWWARARVERRDAWCGGSVRARAGSGCASGVCARWGRGRKCESSQGGFKCNRLWVLKNSSPRKLARIKLRQDALQTTFSVFLDIFYPPNFGYFEENGLFQHPRLITSIQPLTPTCQSRHVCVREYAHPRFQPYIFG
jgi:hypothetical protein